MKLTSNKFLIPFTLIILISSFLIILYRITIS